MRKRLLIGIPLLDVKYEFFTSFMNLWTELITKSQYDVGYTFQFRKPVDKAHTEIAQMAVDTGADYVLLMDDDIYDVKLRDIERLMVEDKDVIGGVMPSKNFPFYPTVHRKSDAKLKLRDMQEDFCNLYDGLTYLSPADQKGVQQVDLISFGCILIKTEVFTKIPKPWFTHPSGKMPFFTDSHFCDNCEENGIDVHAHWEVRLNHAGITIDNIPDHVSMYKKAGKRTMPGMGLNPNELQLHQAMMADKMRKATDRFHKGRIDGFKYETGKGEGKLPAYQCH